MQKISSFYKLILVIQQILEIQALKGHSHFGPQPPKNYYIAFSFPEFVPKHQFKKNILFHSFLHDIQKFLESWEQSGYTIFDHTHANIF